MDKSTWEWVLLVVPIALAVLGSAVSVGGAGLGFGYGWWENDKLLQENTALKSEITYVTGVSDRLDKQHAHDLELMADKDRIIQTKQKEVDTLKEEINSLKAQVQQLLGEATQSKEEAAYWKQESERLQGKVDSLQRQLQQTTSALASIQNAYTQTSEKQKQSAKAAEDAEATLRKMASDYGMQSRSTAGIAYESLVLQVQMKECSPLYRNNKEANCFDQVENKLSGYRSKITSCVEQKFSTPYYLEGGKVSTSGRGSETILKFDRGIVVLCDQHLHD